MQTGKNKGLQLYMSAMQIKIRHVLLLVFAATAKGEMSAKTTYQRSAKGPVTIPECSPDGKFIVLENTGRKVEPRNTRISSLGSWS